MGLCSRDDAGVGKRSGRGEQDLLPQVVRRGRHALGLVSLVVVVVAWGSVIVPVQTSADGLAGPMGGVVRFSPPRQPSGGADFNGDSYGDLVLGTGNTLYVLYGSSTGLAVDASGRAMLGVREVGGRRTTEDAGFGSTASGDFDGDGYADLAVWIEDSRRKRNWHGVHIVYGSSAGLDVSRTTFRRFPKGITGGPLVSGNFGRGRYADLAFGDSGFVLGDSSVGAVYVLYGTKDGLSADRQTWTQDTPGMLSKARHNESFGEVVGGRQLRPDSL